MASELLKNKTLIQRLKEPDVPVVNFNLADSALDYSIESIEEELSTPTNRVADLADDLTPGPLRDELKGTFDPTQETYEEYLRRINARYGGRIGFDRGGMAKLVEYAKSLPKGTVLTRKMVEDYVKKNKLNVNIENFFNRKAPNIKGLKVDTSFQYSGTAKKNIEKFGKSKYDKLSAENKYRVRLGEDVGKLAPEKQQKVKFKKAYDDAKKFYESQGIKFDDKIKERVRKSIATNEGKFVPPGKGAQVFKSKTLKVVRDVFVNNPDADSTDIAKAIYGDKKFNAASLIEKEEMITDARRQVP